VPLYPCSDLRALACQDDDDDEADDARGEAYRVRAAAVRQSRIDCQLAMMKQVQPQSSPHLAPI
jgi:hypothetical protein